MRAMTSGVFLSKRCDDLRGVDRPRENRPAGVIEVQQILHIGALRQDDHAGIRMPGEERNHRPRVAAERLQGEPVLKFAQIEGCRTPESRCGSIHFRKDFLQVEEYLHGRREPDPWRAGQVAVVATVGAEAVGREMPVVRAGIASFIAETHRAAVLAQNERLLAALMQPQWVGFAQIDSIMRNAKRLDDFRFRVSRTNPFGQSPTALGAIASLRQHDPGRPKQRRRPRPMRCQGLSDHEHGAPSPLLDTPRTQPEHERPYTISGHAGLFK